MATQPGLVRLVLTCRVMEMPSLLTVKKGIDAMMLLSSQKSIRTPILNGSFSLRAASAMVHMPPLPQEGRGLAPTERARARRTPGGSRPARWRGWGTGPAPVARPPPLVLADRDDPRPRRAGRAPVLARAVGAPRLRPAPLRRRL